MARQVCIAGHVMSVQESEMAGSMGRYSLHSPTPNDLSSSQGPPTKVSIAVKHDHKLVIEHSNTNLLG